MSSPKKDEHLNPVLVGFNQQQRELIEKLKAEEAFAGSDDSEIVRVGFTQWLKNEGWLSSK